MNKSPDGWTKNLHLDAGAYVLDVNVKPDTCNDENEMLVIDGWNVSVLEVAE